MGKKILNGLLKYVFTFIIVSAMIISVGCLKNNKVNAEEIEIKKGVVFTDEETSAEYKITKVNVRKGEILGGNVTLVKITDKERKNVKIADRVNINEIGFNVTVIGNNALKNCKKLQKLTIGKNIKKVGKNAFRGCKKLKRIVFSGDKVKKIGKNAFKGISEEARFSASVRIYEKLLKLVSKSERR